LLLLAAAVGAVELPVTAVRIGPGWVEVRHEGRLPAGDEIVGGLPLGLDQEALRAVIDGMPSPPALRLRLPALPEPPRMDQAWHDDLAAAEGAFAAAQAMVESAELQERIAHAALGFTFTAADGAKVAPAGELQRALAAFVSRNAEAARERARRGREAREEARARLVELETRREQARPPAAQRAELALPGAAGRVVRLSYRLAGAGWAPEHRVEVSGGSATWVREAILDLPNPSSWPLAPGVAVPLELTASDPEHTVAMPVLSIPELVLGDEVRPDEVSRNRRRTIGRFGGSKASESAVDSANQRFKRTQKADGSWSHGPWQLHSTSLCTFALLGAGYDHKSPSKYRVQVARAVSWLRQRQGRQCDLAGHALLAAALCEAFAMTGDTDLRDVATAAHATLAVRIAGGRELASGLYRRGAMQGPELLYWCAMATKSAAAAGIDATATLATLRNLLPDLRGHPDRAEAGAAAVAAAAMLAAPLPEVPIDDWLAALPGWLAEGRPEIPYLANIGLFQHGGQPWARWNASMRDLFVATQVRMGETRDALRVVPYPLGEDAAHAMIALALEVYYRYAQVGRPGAASDGQAPLPSLAEASLGWPAAHRIAAVALTPGRRQRVVIDRFALPGRIGLRAAPADGAGAWRILDTANPLTGPLLGGPLAVVVDGRSLGVHRQAFCAPAARLLVPLGRDERVRIAREESARDAEAWGKRTRTVTIAYRIDAPAGAYRAIDIEEPMPRPADPAIRLRSVEPAIAEDALDRMLAESPLWSLSVPIEKGQGSARLVYELRHPTTLRATVRSVDDAPAEDAESEQTPPIDQIQTEEAK
jgi:hypothetical protein